MSWHVVPNNDLFEHETSGECWCDPETMYNDPITGELLEEVMIVHNSADARELTE